MAEDNLEEIEKNMREEDKRGEEARSRKDEAETEAAEEETKKDRLQERDLRQMQISRVDEQRRTEQQQDLANQRQQSRDRRERERESRDESEAMGNAAGRYYAGIVNAFNTTAGTLFWLGILKFLVIDGLIGGGFSSLWTTGKWFTYPPIISWVTSVGIFMYVFWVLVIKKTFKERLDWGSSLKALATAFLFFCLDNLIIQNYLSQFTWLYKWDPSDILSYFSIIFGPIFISPYYFIWWSIWGMLIGEFDKKSLAAKLKKFYVLLIIISYIQLLIGGFGLLDRAQELGDIASQNSQLDKAQEQGGVWDYVTVNWARLWNCTSGSPDACQDVGKPAVDAQKKPEVSKDSILQGGVDDKISQDMYIKLVASRNAPVNYWERAVIASATLEATSYTRNIIVSLFCGLKDGTSKVENSGKMTPPSVVVKYQNILGTFEDLSCEMVKPYELKKGSNTVYFTARVASQLELSSYFIVYFIREEDLMNDVNYYLDNDKAAKERFVSLRTSKNIAEAQKDLYGRLYASIINADYPDGKVESKSEPGFIKFIISFGQIPIIPLRPDVSMNMQFAIENMVQGGTIVNITTGQIDLPIWLVPAEDRCPILKEASRTADKVSYSLNPDLLRTVLWKDIKVGPLNQKKLAPCTLKFVGDAADAKVLYNPTTLNPKTIQAKIDYDYELEALGMLDVREPDVTNAKIFAYDLPQKPVQSVGFESVKSNFGLPGYTSRPREGITINGTENSPVYSVMSGTVVAKGCISWGGNFIMIENGQTQYQFMYAHLNSFVGDYKVGRVIGEKQEIGMMGRTAGCKAKCDDQKELCGMPGKVTPQLHFGVYEFAGGAPMKPYCSVMKVYGYTGTCVD